MNKNQFRVTYDIVTPESAEDGDTAEGGFVLPGGWHVDVQTALADKDGEYGMDLRSALELVSGVEDSGSWFSECDGRENYSTGEHETRALHPPDGITRASYGRLKRLLRAY